jgi:hypothetical protein
MAFRSHITKTTNAKANPIKSNERKGYKQEFLGFIFLKKDIDPGPHI